jgi:glycosyltransferase involved in cell wall biosynthesis
MTALKINFVLPTANMAGGIRVVAIYAAELARRGHDVTLVSVPHRLPPFGQRVKDLLRGRGWPRPEREPSHLDALEGVANVRHIVLDRWRPVEDRDLPDADVVVATWWETAEWVARLSPLKGAKTYFVQHHESVFESQPTARVEATYRMPLHKITISRWLVELMRDRYGDDDVTHVPNSVDTNQFHAPARGRQARPTVGLLYHSVPWKGVDISLKAIEHAKRSLPDVHVVSFGVEKQSPSLPLPQGSTYEVSPAQNRLRELYGSCDVWLCGSRAEGFHLPPLEAMACRCPVVSTKVGGPVDVIEQNVNGKLVDVGDAEGLGRALLEVLQLPEPAWRAMSDAAYATATRYTWADATDLFVAGLRVAIDKQKRRSRARISSAGAPPADAAGTAKSSASHGAA